MDYCEQGSWAGGFFPLIFPVDAHRGYARAWAPSGRPRCAPLQVVIGKSSVDDELLGAVMRAAEDGAQFGFVKSLAAFVDNTDR